MSVTGKKNVTGSHGIKLQADVLISQTDLKDGDVLFLPGGMPGTKNLGANEDLLNALLETHKDNRRIAAICAAPSILGRLGLLEGKKATCFPGYEGELSGASVVSQGVVT